MASRRAGLELSNSARAAWSALWLACAAACDPSPAVEVQVPVRVSEDQSTTFETDLGYQVEVASARLALSDMQFAQGAAGTSFGFRLHPGHADGASVTGVLDGEFVFDIVEDAGLELGLADIVVGDYVSATWTLARMDEDGQLLADEDEETGYNCMIRGRAQKADAVYNFEVRTRADLGRELKDAIAEGEIRENDPGSWQFHLNLSDTVTKSTVFDGVDFGELAEEDGEVLQFGPESPGSLRSAWNEMQRRLHSHDFYLLTHQTKESSQ